MTEWTLADAYELLAVAQTFDRRTVGDFDAEAWRRAMHGLQLEDAKQAIVEHFTTSTDWLMPAHVRQGVMRIRRDRLERAPYAVPDADPDDPIAYQRALRDGIVRAADGTERPRDMRAIDSTFPSPPPASRAAIAAARAAIPPRRPRAPQPAAEDSGMAQARAEIAALAARSDDQAALTPPSGLPVGDAELVQGGALIGAAVGGMPIAGAVTPDHGRRLHAPSVAQTADAEAEGTGNVHRVGHASTVAPPSDRTTEPAQ